MSSPNLFDRMLKASRSSQPKVWQKWVAFKTFFILWQKLHNTPWTTFYNLHRKGKSTGTAMSPTALQRKVWGWCLPHSARSRKQGAFSSMAFEPLSGRTEFCWPLTHTAQLRVQQSALKIRSEALPNTLGFSRQAKNFPWAGNLTQELFSS